MDYLTTTYRIDRRVKSLAHCATVPPKRRAVRNSQAPRNPFSFQTRGLNPRDRTVLVGRNRVSKAPIPIGFLIPALARQPQMIDR
jgi:hypothetical protein